jgi:predicted phage terminase large subunit-like protein
VTSAADELARRRRVRGSMVEWARLNNFEPAAHHLLLIDKLEAVARGDIRKLMFFLPPGSAKTTYCNLWVPWYISRAPGKAVLGASHTTEMAERFSRRIRGMVQEHGATLGTNLSEDTQAAARWALTNGSEYMAAGVGQAILGYRIDALLIDDPIRSRDDAFSPTVRENIWEWFHSSARTRLRPGASQILVMSRIHEDDLAARLLHVEDDWTVVHLPAEAEQDDPLGRAPGTMLWSEDPKYPYGEVLREQKKSQLPSIWSSMFQGRPAPETGDYFRAEWFRPMTAMPARERLSIYGSSDFAVSAGKGDFTVHMIVGLDPEGSLYLLDLYRAQSDTATSVDAFLDLVKLWRPLGWAQETGQINSSIGPFLRQRMRERKVFVATETFPTRGDKSVRCQSVRGRLAVNNIFVPQADWWPEVRAELLSFPASRFDDCADALGLIGQILDRMHAPHVPAEKPEPKVLSFESGKTTLTLTDLFDEEDRKYRRGGSRRI